VRCHMIWASIVDLSLLKMSSGTRLCSKKNVLGQEPAICGGEPNQVGRGLGWAAQAASILYGEMPGGFR
jgi:hypothetical protein